MLGQWGQTYSEGVMCLASTWHLTLNFLLDKYPQLRHCHCPPSILTIKDSRLSENGEKKWVYFNSNALFVTSWKMISKTNPIFQNHWTQWTSVTRGSNMFGLNMIPDICPVGLVSTLHTLPLTTPYTCQKVIDIGWKKKRSLKMWHLFWNKIV